MPKVSLHWFRRDLRLTDNTALLAAAASSEQVVPVYIQSEWKTSHHWTGSTRQQFLCGCLDSLAKNLDSVGSRLIIRCGRTDEELERLIKEANAGAVHTNRDPDPFGREMERKVRELCARLGVEFHTHKDHVLHEPDEVRTGEGNPYRVYTPYSRNWLELPKATPKRRVTTLGAAALIESLPLPTLESWSLRACAAELPAAGERAARERMKHFIESGILAAYSQSRDTPEGQHTSRLSQDLRFGLISIRELYQRCAEAGQAKALTYIKELAWREFYMSVLHFWPEVLETEFNPSLRNVPWDSREDFFEAWKHGRTGFPIVDAGMRELLGSGFMHNRVRMITSMFLTKDLHVHWQLGEMFFMQHLVDGEIASNNGGWQWSAGTGADAAPYFRIQNPWTQAKRHDPLGRYMRKWLPELAGVPLENLFAPPLRPLHPDYPMPVVDHSEERDRTLQRFNVAKQHC